ncbi:hypothetical protein OWM54_17075 [Myxococcus sp. MISCRS1]|uniref:hypothetical protein n=1 Tax=Myxococcus sp. MISCRS1 TaxID=2996786 RepID=UPI00226EA662|nr:hypothetical protein [Myxococcus sp. MISCRS1]MCY0998855.1 hypothetical protein [Myxococcus sp. MISCRS1]
MRKTWTLGALGAALGAVLAAGGCYDFDAARKRCLDEGRCEQVPDAGRCIPNTAIDDTPDDTFEDSDCDGVDGRASEGLFVDPMTGDDVNGTGTRDAPLRTLGHALSLVRQWDGGAPTRVYLAGGEYQEGELTLDVPVSLHGGYAGRDGGWRRAGTQVARLEAGPTALTVRGLSDAGIVLEYLRVRSADGQAPGQPSIALRVIGSDVRLRHTVLTAGHGAAGQDGANGDAGAPGPDGGEGTKTLQESPTVPGEGGAGGINLACPGEEGSRSGGDGAPGVHRTAGNDGAPGQPQAGGPPTGGTGGAGGALDTKDCRASPSSCGCNAGDGFAGDAGVAGIPGDAGAFGAGMGTLSEVDGTWTVGAGQNGGAGEPGTSGTGGGGGGSGGSCLIQSSPQITEPASPGGSGGGAGGCGGQGGAGGGGGGASIGLLVFDSNVALETATSIETLGGGAGGRGGTGGRGGSGGEGGLTVGRTNLEDMTYKSGAGGPGGKGGNGGAGGPGGGGGGGPSVGIWCTRSQVTQDDAGTTITQGPGGDGGPSAGTAGEPGASVQTMGCPTSP